MASDSPSTPSPPSNNIGPGKSSPNMKALTRANLEFAKTAKEIRALTVEEALLRSNFKSAKAEVQDVISRMQHAVEKKKEFTTMRVAMRELVDQERAQENELNFFTIAPRNLSESSARGSVPHAMEVPDMILINEVLQKSVGDTTIGEDLEIAKQTSV